MIDPDLISDKGTEDEDAQSYAEVYSLDAYRQSRQPKPTISKTGSTGPIEYQSPRDHRPRVRKRQVRPFDDALDLIADAGDEGLTRVERSNAFDTWKERIVVAAGDSLVHTPEYREILGLLITCTLKRDLFDVPPDLLAALRDATVRLRSPRAADIDVHVISKALRKAGASIVLPLSGAASEETVSALVQMGLLEPEEA